MSNYYELTIDQGCSFAMTIELKDYFTNESMNLAGYIARSQIRKNHDTQDNTSFQVSISDASNGVISMTMSPVITASLKSGRYVYDLEIEDTNAFVTRVIQGVAVVTPQVTR